MHAPPDGWPLSAAATVVLHDPRVQAAWDELAARGLLTVERGRVLAVFPRTKVRRTPAGDLWADDARARETALQAAVSRPPGEVALQAAAMGGLVLLLAPPVLAELDDAVNRLRATDGGGSAGASGGGGDDDLDLDGALALGDLSALDSLDHSFDSAVDSGFSDGGGGGDGGGS